MDLAASISPVSLQRFLVGICTIGPRWHGTDGEEQSIQFMRHELEKTCDRVELEDFPYAQYSPIASSLQILRPTDRSVRCFALEYSHSGTAEGETVYVGEGWPKDFQAIRQAGISIQKRIILARTNRPYVAGRLAIAEHAAGIVIISDSPYGTIRQITSQMGYTEGDDLACFGLGIPGVIVGREDGDALLSLLSAGNLKVRIDHAGSVQVRTSQNVIGYRFGKDEPDHTVILGAHYDTQAGIQGAWDNGSGCAALLEIARVSAREKPLRTMVFCAFGGEEIGLFGSTHFVRNRITELKNTICYANLDSTSGDLPYSHDLFATEGIQNSVQNLVSTQTDWKITNCRAFTPLDHEQDSAEFVRHGVDSFWAHEEGNAFFHTTYDTLETVDPMKLARATRATFLPTWYFASSSYQRTNDR
jgi:Iap family predicted aminopeptidase